MQPSTKLADKVLLYCLTCFSLLFVVYIVLVGLFNRLAFGDYLSLWALENFGIFSPIKYWYIYWQGRIGPHSLSTMTLLLYKATGTLLPFTLLLGAVFVFVIYRILKRLFDFPRLMAVNYSVLLFAAMVLCSFEASTFFWVTASVAYFGGILFLLIGIDTLLKNTGTFASYALITICFLYVGSSSEHFGSLVLLSLLLFLLYLFFDAAYRSASFGALYSNFTMPRVNKALLTAFAFCLIAFFVMLLAPGTKIRMSHTPRPETVMALARKTYDATKFVGLHIFYKLPYIVALIPVFFVAGRYVKSDVFSKLNYRILALAFVALPVVIVIGNLPVVFALSTVGPLRAYAYVSFLLIVFLLFASAYAGWRLRTRTSHFTYVAIAAACTWIAFVGYTTFHEIPLLRQYAAIDKARLTAIEAHRELRRSDPLYVEATPELEYVSLTDWWRNVTGTAHAPSAMMDLPVVIMDFDGESTAAAQVKLGLNVNFSIHSVNEMPK